MTTKPTQTSQILEGIQSELGRAGPKEELDVIVSAQPSPDLEDGLSQANIQLAMQPVCTYLDRKGIGYSPTDTLPMQHLRLTAEQIQELAGELATAQTGYTYSICGDLAGELTENGQD